jgi:hypothetical protein
LNRKSPAWNFYDWAIVEIIAEEGGVDGGRHQNDPEVWVQMNHVSQHNQDKVRVYVPLVNFIHDDVRNAA